METVKIYELVDPRSGLPRYIGYTSTRLQRRLSQHLSDSHEKNTYRANWIKSLQLDGLLPIINEVDEVPRSEWEFWERYYISLFRSWGFNLTNLTDGGKSMPWGSHTRQAVEKQVLSRRKNKRPRSPEVIERIRKFHLGRKRSELTRYKLSLKAKGRGKGIKKTEEHRKKIAVALSGRIFSNETKEKMRKARLGSVAYNRMTIARVDPVSNERKIYESIAGAVREGFDGSTISGCINNKLKQHKGFIWCKV